LQMGGTLGVAVFLTILFNVLPHRITRAFGGQLPLGFDSHRLDEVQSDTSGIAHLPDAIRIPLLIGVTDSLHVVFCAIALSALVGAVVLLFMKEIPLQGDSGAHNTVAGLDSSSEPIGDRPGTHLVYGRIRRSDTFPVAGAVLTLIDYRGHQVARATSDSAGRYRITAPRPGNYVLIASANQYQPTALNISLSEWQHIQDLVLSGSGEVSGVVWSSGQGEVVSGAAVTVTDERGEVVGAALSDHEGRYVCRGISAGTYTLVAVSEHLRPYATSLVVPEGGLRNFVIELTALAELAGAVWANGRSVPDALVTIVDSTGKPVAATRTDEDGNYLIPDLEEGEYTVVARGYPPMTSRVTISDRRHDHNILLGYPEITPPETNSEIAEASNAER
ncbi:MAG: carboxypeptidase regulatory-like domain-containing protein, partial [Mycobacterium sp.]|nr:carboxypeptidase regulatory-like domain-containing protein [Mycobacterium sp.]